MTDSSLSFLPRGQIERLTAPLALSITTDPRVTAPTVRRPGEGRTSLRAETPHLVTAIIDERGTTVLTELGDAISCHLYADIISRLPVVARSPCKCKSRIHDIR